MNDMLFGFILGVFAMVLKDVINYFWSLGTRPVELPHDPVAMWRVETEEKLRKIDEEMKEKKS